jgi:hypothetical protein
MAADFGFTTISLWTDEELENLIGPEKDDWLAALTLDELQSIIDGCTRGL